MPGWVGPARRLVLKIKDRAQRASVRLRSAMRADDPNVSLERVQRRLELLLTAVYGRPIPIAPIETNLWNRERVRQLAKRDPRAREPAPGVDGATIYLPPELGARSGDADAIARYRLFALEQAERIVRGTAVLAPLNDPLERDLYMVREGAAIDARIAGAHPGIVEALSDERRAVLARRPPLERLNEAERDVERLVREALSAELSAEPSPSSEPSASLAWARDTAKRIRSASGSAAKYRGVPPASIWGIVRSNASALPQPGDAGKHFIRTGNTEANAQESQHGEQAQGSGSGPGRSTERDDSAADARGSREAGGAAGREIDRSPTTTGERGTTSGVRPYDNADEHLLEGLPPPIWYDEWNADRGAYVKHGAAVRAGPAQEGDDDWARATLHRHAAIVREIRHRFERLRARRALLRRQRAGDDLDLDACVNAVVDRRIGHPPDDRLYVDARPARRGLAIAFLTDVSGSTETRVSNDLRIVDIEKIALLLAGEALDALGDSYAMYAFAGKTSANVKVTTLKQFADRNDEVTRRRIAALEPAGFTRLGAAVRHATRQLARQAAGHRLLLLLSDGRPNDIDQYQSDYGVEDSRQAIFEARASGIYPFCLTVDRDASEYLPRIFGQAGHTIVQRPEQLPTALLGAVRSLIKRS
ncbi:MAG TPA: VWA domain-containing protein [Gemmatimonadaceae bacterium]|nr:VWA domain-containing protein [Gemmatimonadaceae bacterium]